MTILFFSRLYYPHIGGVEKHVSEISKVLVSKGHRVVVISEQPQGAHSFSYQSKSLSARATGKLESIESYNIKVGKDDFFKKFRIWKDLWKYRKLIKTADVVHCHDVFFWYLPFRFLFPFKKVYTTFHGYEGNNIPNRRSILMHKLAEKFSYGNICIGGFFSKWYGTNPTVVSYGAVDIDKFKQEKDKYEAIFVGRLEEETGIMKYLQALKLLKDRGINLTLTILGDGALAGLSKEFVKDNSLNVDFKGFVDNVDEFINSGRYIFVSRYLGILEALAAKKPIFAEYENAIKKDYLEMAPFAKFISISKSAEDIANDLTELINHKINLDIGSAYKWVKDKTWENLTNTYLRLWKME